jgi:predicted dehydrogenase
VADRLRIGMIGYAFMGRAHSQAWRTVRAFFDVALRPEMVAICGRDREAVSRAADTLGWAEAVTDWRELVERDDIDLVDICSPGGNHLEPALAALAAGKHVLCEKPLANTVAEAEQMAAAARQARERGVRAMVGFNYRRVPALELARRLVADGRLGRIHHVRAVYLQDWIVDPEFPLVWRLRREEAGSGSLGDIGSHIVDITQHILGDRIATVSGLTETFVRERPLPAAASGLAAIAGNERGEVTVDDAALFLARFSGGAVASFEATRFAPGRRNGMRVEVNGSRGSVAFNMERLNELEFYDGADPKGTQGFRTILVTEPEHPWAGRWWPPGHILGWEHTFTHEVADLVDDIAAGRDPQPGFDDGLQVQRVLEAVERSAANGGWEDVG